MTRRVRLLLAAALAGLLAGAGCLATPARIVIALPASTAPSLVHIAIQLRQADFVEVVERAVTHAGMPIGVDLEITESLIMRDVEDTIRKLERLRRLGMCIAIDDFGTGYSSLAYLSRLPVEMLKIDCSFIIKMLHDPNTMTLVQTMLSLAHSMGLQVVAKGVDEEEQAKVLRLLRCDQMQGYVFAKPMPAAEVAVLLAAPGGTP